MTHQKISEDMIEYIASYICEEQDREGRALIDIELIDAIQNAEDAFIGGAR